MAWGKLLPEGHVQRAMTAATFVNTIGNGMYMTVMIMYFTRSVGLPAGQVGLGLTVAGLAGLVAAVPVGHLADRRGPREVYVALSVLSAFVMVGFTAVHSFWPFLVVATVENLAASSSRAARGAMIARAGGDSPAAFRAYLRSVTNVGISLGGGVAALGLVFDTRAWYVGLILVNGLTYLVNAAMTMAVPHLAPHAVPAGSGRWIALRDRRFLAVVSVMAVMTVQFEVLTFAAPLWISHAGHAPRWTVAVLMVTNTVLVAALQVRMSRGVDSIAKGVRATVRSGWVFAVAAVLFGLSGQIPGWAAAAVLVLAAVVHTVGEIVQQAGVFELGFGLAADHAQGQYQGLMSTFSGAMLAFAPAALSVLCVSGGMVGWLVLGAVMAGAGSLMPLAVQVRPPRWAVLGTEAVEPQDGPEGTVTELQPA